MTLMGNFVLLNMLLNALEAVEWRESEGSQEGVNNFKKYLELH